MYPTVEMRWFYPGAIIPDPVETWFQALEAESQPQRTDHYLRLTGGDDSLGIKLREGNIEIKQRYQSYGLISLYNRIAGYMEHWRKWSFTAAGSTGPFPASAWLAVQKERRMRKYRLDPAGRLEAVPLLESLRQGCELELARLQIANRPYWSVCLEAFGPEPALSETLLGIGQQIGQELEPPLFEAKDSYSYPAWLKKITA